MSEIVTVGPFAIPAEVVALRADRVTLQAYEYTGGLRPGDQAIAQGRMLSAELGPDLLGGVFDGLLRPLSGAATWLSPDALRSRDEREWVFEPVAAAGRNVQPGDVLGTLPKRGGLDQHVLVPPGVSGEISWLAAPGSYRADEVVARISQHSNSPDPGRRPPQEVTLTQSWPMRSPRPVSRRLAPTLPLLTRQRVIDLLFPLLRGSTAAVPGGFGTGKTLLLQQIAKWCDADVIVYVGCGERGNEMADVITEFAELADPRTAGRLADRTVIVANTSNMPMMAREVSIYAGVTVAEYFRDMGYDAVVIADSTSRWAEALREFASRRGQLPAEEGYPADLGSALAAFYERAGAVVTLGGRSGSVTVIGAVSPPGGDLTEPVSAMTQRFVRTQWTLDRELAYARHYPAVAWNGSFSRDDAAAGRQFVRSGDDAWPARRARMAALLADADRLTALAELVGVGALPARERVTILAGRLLREGLLQQSALSDNDAACTAGKAAAIADALLTVIDRGLQLVDQGTPATDIEQCDFGQLVRARQELLPDDVTAVRERRDAVLDALPSQRYPS
jgi:V/A-type H+-transporting ATPase subunit A